MTKTYDRNWFVRAPASSANLGAGFDVLGMALNLYADCGFGKAPPGAQQIDTHHPGRIAFEALGGTGPMWMRCNIPMGRGLGFSGAARVSAAALAAVQTVGSEGIVDRGHEILALATKLEGHGDNVAASLRGGVTGFVQGEMVSMPVGPTMTEANFVAWVPDVTTSTDKSREALSETVDRADAVHNIGRTVQFVMAFCQRRPVATGVGDSRSTAPVRSAAKSSRSRRGARGRRLRLEHGLAGCLAVVPLLDCCVRQVSLSLLQRHCPPADIPNCCRSTLLVAGWNANYVARRRFQPSRRSLTCGSGQHGGREGDNPHWGGTWFNKDFRACRYRRYGCCTDRAILLYNHLVASSARNDKEPRQALAVGAAVVSFQLGLSLTARKIRGSPPLCR